MGHTIRRDGLRLLLSVMALLSAPAFAAGYQEEILANGLRVILVEHHANPMVASSVVVGAGVLNEPEGMSGASHFLEHLLFNGTQSRTQRQLYDEVDRYGAYNNATTREDHTLFTLLIQKEFAEQGLAIQADMLFHSTLPQDKFDKEKGIILEELAKDRNDPEYLAEEGFRAFAYGGTPLARPVLGSEASIQAMKRDDVLAYYRSRYVPSNMLLLVMGDFDRASMLEAIQRTFGAAPKASAPARDRLEWPPAPEKNWAAKPLDAGRVYLRAAFPIPFAPHEPQAAAVELLLSALSEGKDSPLASVLSSGADPLTLSFSLGLAPRAAPWSAVEFEAVLPKVGDPKAVLDRVAEGVLGLRPGSPAWDRLAGARESARADEVLTADQIQYFAMTRSAYLLGSPPGYLARRAAILDSLDDESLARAAEAIRKGFGSVRIGVMGPDVAEGTRAWTSPTAPAAVPARATVETSEVLPSGLEAWVQRNDDSQVFAVHLLFRARSASEPAGKAGIADFLHRMFLRGSIVHDAASLSAALDRVGAKIKLVDDPAIPFDDYYTTPEFSFVRIEMPAEGWREGVALLGEIVRFPALRDDDVEAVRKEMLDLRKRQTESTRAVAQDLTSRTLAPGSPLSQPVLGTAESISSITTSDLRAFQGAYVTGRRMMLTAVGPVPPAEVLAAVRGAFSTIPAGESLPAVAPPPITPHGLRAEATVGKGQAYIDLAYLFDAEPRDQAALAVAGAMLSDRLSFGLREEKGLAYSMAASIQPFASRMKFETVMGTRQANVDEALAGLRLGISQFAASEPEPAAVERAVNALRGRMLMRRMARINQAYFAALELAAGRKPGDDLGRLDALKRVTSQDVARVARKYLDPARCAVVIVR